MPAGISFLQRKIQPDQAKDCSDRPRVPAGMLRLVSIDRMLVDERRISLCYHITGEIAEGQPALARGLEPARRVKVPVRQFQQAPGTYDCHSCTYLRILF